MRMLEGEWRGGVFQMTRMTKMFHRVATKANTELIAQQIISAMKTPPVCESSTLVKKKHFGVLFVSMLSVASAKKRQRQEFQFAVCYMKTFVKTLILNFRYPRSWVQSTLAVSSNS